MNAHLRAQDLKRLQSETFDLLIIGGGINGAGVARDAASRGMKVALIEAKDFAIGTSSRSSKLIHGGIRYLENLEFGLVFEALSERRHLFEIAPHLVHPLRFVIPLYESSRVSPWLMGLGMMLYDALALFETPQPAERLSLAEVQERYPILNSSRLKAAYAYSDAYMDDDRLVLETLRSAVAQGACVLSYVKAEGGQLADQRLEQVVAVDTLSQQKFTIRAKHFVSTVGPWTDAVAPRLLGQWKKQMRPSKGVHLTFSRQRFPLQDAVVMGAEKRIVFAIPRHEMVIVGTTDTDYPGDPYEVRTERNDVEYILSVIGQYFPGAQISEKDILASYSGVRPLVDDRSATESQTSREHTILSDARNLTVVMGGKYTTYRLIAEQTVDAALAHFSFEDQVRFAKSHTLTPLNPMITASAYENREQTVRELERATGRPRELIAPLVERHGLEAEPILKLELPCKQSMTVDEELWAREALHAVRATQCFSLADFFLRRTPLVLSRADHGRRYLSVVAATLAAEFGWSDERIDAERMQLENALSHELGWRRG